MDVQAWLNTAERGDAGGLSRLLASGADADARTPGGETALMRAAARGHVEAVRVLLGAGADPNTSRRDGMTALMLASFFGHAEVVRALVSAGAGVSATDRRGANAFEWAVSRGNNEVARLLKETGTGAGLYGKRRAADADARSDEQVERQEPARVSLPPAASREGDELTQAAPFSNVAAADDAPPSKPDAAAAGMSSRESAPSGAAPPLPNGAEPFDDGVRRHETRGQVAVIDGRARGRSKWRRGAAFAVPVLLLVCGVLFYRLAQVRPPTEGPPTEARAAGQPPAGEGQAQPAQPLTLPPQSTEPTGAQPTPTLAALPTPAPAPLVVVPNTGRAVDLTTPLQPRRADLPLSSEPVVIESGQPEEDAARLPRSPAPGSNANSVQETVTRRETIAPRTPPPPDSAAPKQASTPPPNPSPTPKRKVIQWP